MIYISMAIIYAKEKEKLIKGFLKFLETFLDMDIEIYSIFRAYNSETETIKENYIIFPKDIQSQYVINMLSELSKKTLDCQITERRI